MGDVEIEFRDIPEGSFSFVVKKDGSTEIMKTRKASIFKDAGCVTSILVTAGSREDLREALIQEAIEYLILLKYGYRLNS